MESMSLKNVFILLHWSRLGTNIGECIIVRGKKKAPSLLNDCITFTFGGWSGIQIHMSSGHLSG